MLDFFSIFTKGGLVLWYFQAECMKAELRDVINKLLHFAIINVSLLIKFKNIIKIN